jgi:hypothetical protein
MNNATFLPINLLILLLSYPSFINFLPAFLVQSPLPGGLGLSGEEFKYSVSSIRTSVL